jgi:hypothetical protein
MPHNWIKIDDLHDKCDNCGWMRIKFYYKGNNEYKYFKQDHNPCYFNAPNCEL